MSMMIMFGVGAFGRFFVQEQHIIAAKKVIRVRATILPMAVQKSYEPPRKCFVCLRAGFQRNICAYRKQPLLRCLLGFIYSSLKSLHLFLV